MLGSKVAQVVWRLAEQAELMDETQAMRGPCLVDHRPWEFHSLYGVYVHGRAVIVRKMMVVET